MKSYRLRSSHSEDLASGRVIEPGQKVELTAEEERVPHNQRLIAEGRLLEIKPASRGRKPAATEEGDES